MIVHVAETARLGSEDDVAVEVAIDERDGVATRTCRVKPELLAPAGDRDCLIAAIENGADAVYFGLKHFSARAKVGFGLDDLPEVMRTLHRRGVRGYLTFNTLIFEHELEEAAKTAACVIEAGADALIVQDLGMLRLLRRIAHSGVELHASTQMSVHNRAGAEALRQLGFPRVVLARELTFEEVGEITSTAGIETEVFIHGALCYSYSGLCLFSSQTLGRSGNRGKCAYSCL